MKKFFLFIMIVSLAAFFACGCAGKAGNGPDTEKGPETGAVSEPETEEENPFGYEEPAEAVSLDLSREDPSDTRMQFTYDDDGRVIQCEYTLRDRPVVVRYSYGEGFAQVYAFLDGVVTADKRIGLSAFEPALGFSVIEGYYFNGFSPAPVE